MARATLFTAATTGDIAAIERFLSQPDVLTDALAIETRISDFAILRYAGHAAPFTGPVAAYPAWMYRTRGDQDNHFFHTVAQHGQYEVIEWLFTSHISTALPRTLQFFLVDIATTSIPLADVATVEFLLTSHAWATFPERARPALLSALLEAAINTGSCLAASLVVSHGADCNRLLPTFHDTPLTHAAGPHASPVLIDALWNDGAFTVGVAAAMPHAAERGNAQVVARLLELGVDARATNFRLETALHHAAERGFWKAATVLLENASVDLDLQNVDGVSALNAAARGYRLVDDTADAEQDQSYRRVISGLLGGGANPDLCASGQSHFDYAPLHWAVKLPSVPLKRLLLRYGADANVRTAVRADTPAHLLPVEEASLTILDLLVDHGADLNLEDASRRTPLDYLRQTVYGSAWIEINVREGRVESVN